MVSSFLGRLIQCLPVNILGQGLPIFFIKKAMTQDVVLGHMSSGSGRSIRVFMKRLWISFITALHSFAPLACIILSNREDAAANNVKNTAASNRLVQHSRTLCCICYACIVIGLISSFQFPFPLLGRSSDVKKSPLLSCGCTVTRDVTWLRSTHGQLFETDWNHCIGLYATPKNGYFGL